LKFYYKERTAKNQCKVLSEEKGMLTIQMRNGGKFLVSKKSVLKEARSFGDPIDNDETRKRIGKVLDLLNDTGEAFDRIRDSMIPGTLPHNFVTQAMKSFYITKNMTNKASNEFDKYIEKEKSRDA